MYNERTQNTLDQVKEYYGNVPDVYIAMADAGVVSRVWSLSAPTFFTGEATDEDKRVCAVVVGQAVGSESLIEAHYMILRRMGWTREELEGLIAEKYPERLSEKQILFAKLAKSLAINPLQVDQEIVKEVQNIATKKAVSEIVSLVAFVRYTSTFVGVYGQNEPEKHIEHLKQQA